LLYNAQKKDDTHIYTHTHPNKWKIPDILVKHLGNYDCGNSPKANAGVKKDKREGPRYTIVNSLST